MLKSFLISLMMVLFYNSNAFSATQAVMPGSMLTGDYGCIMKKLFDDNENKFRRVLRGSEYLYDGEFINQNGVVIRSSGLHGTGVFDALNLSFHHDLDNYEGKMNLVINKEKAELNGYWYSFGEKTLLGTMDCKRL
jgi:hypothetical protein